MGGFKSINRLLYLSVSKFISQRDSANSRGAPSTTERDEYELIRTNNRGRGENQGPGFIYLSLILPILQTEPHHVAKSARSLIRPSVDQSPRR